MRTFDAGTGRASGWSGRHIGTRSSSPSSIKEGSTHLYPARVNQSEFAGLEDTFFGFVKGWKHWANQSAQTAANSGDRWVPVLQGHAISGDLRLPTSAEEHFMAFYSIHLGADGLAFWSKYRSVTSPAAPGQPFQDDGNAWASQVLQPLTAEVRILADALSTGAIVGAVTSSHVDVSAKLYQDPDTGEYYLSVLNTRSGSRSATLDLTALAQSIGGITPLGSTPAGGQLVGNTFTVSLNSYEARNYRLEVPVPEPCLLSLLVPLTLLRTTRPRT